MPYATVISTTATAMVLEAAMPAWADDFKLLDAPLNAPWIEHRQI